MVLGGNWAMGAVVIDNNSRRPSKLHDQLWYVAKLSEGNTAVLDELMQDSRMSEDDKNNIIDMV